MAIAQQEVSIVEGANKLFVFDEIYSFRAAQEQAEKRN